MTQLLISVKNQEEALSVQNCDVDILDVKNPDRGALGAADPPELVKIRRLFPHRTLSFSAGELKDWVHAGPFESIYPSRISNHFGFIKVGLEGCLQLNRWQETLTDFWKSIPKESSPVAVGYFDHRSCQAPELNQVVELAESFLACQTVLMDTFEKSKSLFDWIEPSELKKMVSRCHRKNLQCVVAGSIRFDTLDPVLASGTDVIAVRGMICNDNDRATLSSDLVQQLSLHLKNQAGTKTFSVE
ncbi:MAG: (5-formylfuran-3-yl)methyl phosphate synthase [Planctomycetota bacterium]